MTKYRDLLSEQDEILGSIVGCGLDRLNNELNRNLSGVEIQQAINLYNDYPLYFLGTNPNSMPIGSRRETIAEYVRTGIIPKYVNESN